MCVCVCVFVCLCKTHLIGSDTIITWSVQNFCLKFDLGAEKGCCFTANCYLISDQMGGIFNAIFAVANIMNANANNQFYRVYNQYDVAVWWPSNFFKLANGKLHRWTGCGMHHFKVE